MGGAPDDGGMMVVSRLEEEEMGDWRAGEAFG
jgi:hypothetical protein